jgi:hypothetical protein
MYGRRQTNLDFSFRGDEDVGGLEVSVNDPVVVEIGDPVNDLPEKRLEDG